jgi:hypothetical protein
MRQGPFPDVWPVSRFLTSTITFQTFEHKIRFSYTFENWELDFCLALLQVIQISFLSSNDCISDPTNSFDSIKFLFAYSC